MLSISLRQGPYTWEKRDMVRVIRTVYFRHLI